MKNARWILALLPVVVACALGFLILVGRLTTPAFVAAPRPAPEHPAELGTEPTPPPPSEIPAPTHVTSPGPNDRAIEALPEGVIAIRRAPSLQPVDGGFAWSSRTLDAVFQADGVSVSPALPADRPSPVLRLALEEVRSGDRVVAQGGSLAPRLGRLPDQVEYDRGAVVERYTARGRGLEQDFVLEESLEAAELRVTCRVGGDLTPPEEGSRGRQLAFREKDRGALTISEAVAVDAQGRRLPLDLTYARGQISMIVPREWMAQAAYPVTIDPLVGSSFVIDTNSGGPDVAYNSVRNEWLVVWDETSVAPARVVMGQRISATGALLGGPITIATTTLKNFSARVSYAPNVDRYLVVWTFFDANYKDKAPSQIRGRVLTGTGTAFTGEFTVASETASQSPAVAYDGAQWFVAWVQIIYSSPSFASYVHGQFVTTAGALGGAAAPDSVLSVRGNLHLAFGSARYVAAWSQQASGSTWEVRARAMDAAGAFPAASVVVDGAISPGVIDVSHSSGKFLYTWPTAAGELRGRSSDSALAFTGPSFVVNSGTPGPKSPAVVGTSDRWLAVYEGPNSSGNILSNEVAPGGGVLGVVSIATTTGNRSARGAWNSSANDALVTYENTATSPLQILGQRYHFLLISPTNVVATSGNQTVGLTWTASNGATSYTVQRSTVRGQTGVTIGNPTTTSFTDNGLTNGIPYYYRVIANGGAGSSDPSAEVRAIPMGPYPTGLVATASTGQVSLTWSAVPGATSYGVYRTDQSDHSGLFSPRIATTTSPSYVDTQVSNGILYYYNVTAVVGGGESSYSDEVSATPLAPASPSALLVVGSTTLGAGDQAIAGRLSGMGLPVTVVSGPNSATTQASGKALVILSSTVTSADVNTKFRDVAVPVLCWESSLFGPMGMTGTVSGTDFGTKTAQTQIAITSPGHPLAAGFSGTVTVVNSAQTFSWGKPAAGATIATAAGDAVKSTLFAYDTNVPMPGRVAPARRVGFYFENTTASAGNSNGGVLFDAAVRWAMSGSETPPAAPVAVWVQAESGKNTINWSPVVGVMSYTILWSTSPTGPFTILATGLSGNSFVHSGLSNGTTYYYQVVAAGRSTLSQASPSASGRPATVTVVAAIAGNTVIRKFPASGVLDSSNQGDYSAYVAKSVNGVVQPLTADGTTIVDGLTYWEVPAGAPLTITAQTSISCTLKVTGGGKMDLVPLFYTVVLSTAETTSQVFYVDLDDRRYLKVLFRFPEDEFGKTQRSGFGNFWDTSDVIRNNARQALADDLSSKAKPYWARYGISLIGYGDTTKLNDGFCDATGTLITSRTRMSNGTTYRSDECDALGAASLGACVNVYLLHAVANRSATGSLVPILGATAVDLTSGGGHAVHVFLGDDAGPDSLAHEIGHAMDLDDVLTATKDCIGSLNNVRRVFGDTEGMNRLLMRQLGQGRYQAPTGFDWVTDVQSRITRPAADRNGIVYMRD